MSIIRATAATQGAVVQPFVDQSERALVERARRGDHGAFEAIVDGRLAGTFRTVLAILGDEAEARDVTQAIFVQAWQHLPSLRDVDVFGAWFSRIVVNAARSSMRRRRRRTVREISFDGMSEAGTEVATAGVAHEDQTASIDRLERAFDRLSEGERSCLWLHHHEGLPLAEIAAQLGVPAKTVKSRLFTARRALERALATEDR